MPQNATFGRRGVRPAAPTRSVGRPEPLNAELEAFAASIKDVQRGDAADFAKWRRRQLPHRVSIVVVGIILMAPGLVCFVVQAPWWLSLALEAGGVAANGWLRRERRRQASAIAAWGSDAPLDYGDAGR